MCVSLRILKLRCHILWSYEVYSFFGFMGRTKSDVTGCIDVKCTYCNYALVETTYHLTTHRCQQLSCVSAVKPEAKFVMLSEAEQV